MEKQKAFTLSHVAQHTSEQSCWLVIGDRVLDVTEFLEEHPGGVEVLLESSGKDATTNFEYVHHSNLAKSMLLKYQIGVLDHHHIEEDDATNAPHYKDSEPNGKVEAFVLKEDPTSKYASFLEFLVSILMVVSFLAYHYLSQPFP